MQKLKEGVVLGMVAFLIVEVTEGLFAMMARKVQPVHVTPTVQHIYGCTDKNAKNYNRNADRDNGSCVYYKLGCTDSTAKNYDENAEKDDGTCIYDVKDGTASAINNTKNNSNDGQEIFILGYIILTLIALFSKKINSKTILAKKIMHSKMIFRSTLLLCYIALVLPLIIDILYIIANKLNKDVSF